MTHEKERPGQGAPHIAAVTQFTADGRAMDHLTELNTPAGWLRWLFNGEEPGGQISISRYSGVRGAKSIRDGLKAHSATEAAAIATRLDADSVGVFFRLTLLAPDFAGTSRGLSTEAYRCYAVMLDCDTESLVAHKSSKYPDTWEQWEKVLTLAGMPAPTALVSSGYGYYPVWKLSTATEECERVAALQQGIADVVGAWAKHIGPGADGWKLDRTFDLARVYKIPGTHNRKDWDAPRRVEVLSADGPLYAFQELEMALLAAPRPAAAAPASVALSPAGDPFATSSSLFSPVTDVRVIRSGDQPYTEAAAKEFLGKAIEKLLKHEDGINNALTCFARQYAHFPAEQYAFGGQAGCELVVQASLGLQEGWGELDEDDLRAISQGFKYQARDRAAGDMAQGWEAYVPQEIAEVEEGSTHGGWAAVDLSAVLDGTHETVVPTLGTRSDGQPMLYAGKEHSIASEPECGKTWWVLMQVLSILESGGNVVYVDFEDDESTIVGRLYRVLGAEREWLAPDRFRYIRPERKPQPEEYEALLDFPSGSVALVVLDGVTEGMGLLGLEINSNDDSPKWRSTFVKPAMRRGAATLSTDHVVKSKDNRGRYAIGGQHKLAGLNGVMFQMEQVHAFGKGLRGKSRINVSKDRNGGLRGHGEATREPGITYIGDLVGDATEGQAVWTFYPPKVSEEEREELAGPQPASEIRGVVPVVLRHVGANPGQNATAIKGSIEGNDGKIVKALEWLVAAGKVRVETGARNSKSYFAVDQWEAAEVEPGQSGSPA